MSSISYGGEILVVDDKPLVARALAEELINQGFKVQLANTGDEALAVFARRPSAAVITELDLPRMNGIALIERLRATRHTRWCRRRTRAATRRERPGDGSTRVGDVRE
jgi:DNA-binding response OmpR family regulator